MSSNTTPLGSGESKNLPRNIQPSEDTTLPQNESAGKADAIVNKGGRRAKMKEVFKNKSIYPTSENIKQKEELEKVQQTGRESAKSSRSDSPRRPDSPRTRMGEKAEDPLDAEEGLKLLEELEADLRADQEKAKKKESTFKQAHKPSKDKEKESSLSTHRKKADQSSSSPPLTHTRRPKIPSILPDSPDKSSSPSFTLDPKLAERDFEEETGRAFNDSISTFKNPPRSSSREGIQRTERYGDLQKRAGLKKGTVEYSVKNYKENLLQGIENEEEMKNKQKLLLKRISKDDTLGDEERKRLSAEVKAFPDYFDRGLDKKADTAKGSIDLINKMNDRFINLLLKIRTLFFGAAHDQKYINAFDDIIKKQREVSRNLQDAYNSNLKEIDLLSLDQYKPKPSTFIDQHLSLILRMLAGEIPPDSIPKLQKSLEIIRAYADPEKYTKPEKDWVSNEELENAINTFLAVIRLATQNQTQSSKKVEDIL